MKEMKNVPKLRFPGFTGEWEQRKLGELTERVQGNDGRMDLPTLTVSAGNGWMAQEDRFNRNMAGNEQKRYTLLKQGELSYNHGNSKLAKYGVVFVLQTYKEALVPRVYHSFRMINDNDAKFCEYVFETKRPDRELSKLISSGARMDGLLNINYEDFMGINIKIPDIKEQTAIRKHLENFDTLISLQQRKLDQIKEYKKAMLQKMFPKDGAAVPEVRFPGFSGEWERKKLGDEAIEILAGGDIDKNRKVESGKYPVIANALTGEGIVGYYDDYYRVEAPAVTVTGRGDVGHAQARISNFTPVVRLLAVRSNHDSYFLENAINNHRVLVESTGVPQLTVPQLSAYIISFPESVQEEQSIGALFHNLDNLITLHQRKLDAMREYKKGLLQQMFV